MISIAWINMVMPEGFIIIFVSDPEVNVDNCEKWFPLVKLCAPLKNLSSNAVHQTQDALAMTALKSSIQNYKSIKQENGSSTWNLQPINNAFLQSVLNLVSHMHDKKRILFMLYFMSNSAPAGADQVEAARECYLFARANEEELKNDQRAKENVIKIYRKYPMYRIQHLLHVYGLDEDRFFQLVESPKELITALYHHESVTKADSKIDINQVCVMNRSNQSSLIVTNKLNACFVVYTFRLVPK